ncbi:hypothetical protein JTE88_03535 [Arcanobacterium phocisimile]|uniref:Transposase n=1 Tax=Arcanobacterium phocisimile TaxID=1302235 RepID=A0ABX7IL21_9ACTO|nr:hypothetical protein [Arcanobacterium phocisimile]QRV02810.1 hypothetical protein JTE88_03535 [Arcanobacterium phocisimile]
MNISTPTQASSWLVQYTQWETLWHDMGKERSYLGPRPTSITDQRRWWWTHRNLRSVRGMYRAMIKNNTLFTCLKPLTVNPQTQTTSPLEGTVNAAIKRLLSQHRGLSIAHACRPAEWYLNTKT